MTIDLTSAGNRALETLDSVSDFQNVEKLVNFKHDMIQFQNNLAIVDKAMRKVDAFIKSNPTIEVEARPYPVSNTPGSENQLHLRPTIQDVGTSTLSDPLAMNKLKLTDSRVLTSGLPHFLPPMYRSGNSIEDFL